MRRNEIRLALDSRRLANQEGYSLSFARSLSSQHTRGGKESKVNSKHSLVSTLDPRRSSQRIEPSDLGSDKRLVSALERDSERAARSGEPPSASCSRSLSLAISRVASGHSLKWLAPQLTNGQHNPLVVGSFFLFSSPFLYLCFCCCCCSSLSRPMAIKRVLLGRVLY